MLQGSSNRILLVTFVAVFALSTSYLGRAQNKSELENIHQKIKENKKRRASNATDRKSAPRYD